MKSSLGYWRQVAQKVSQRYGRCKRFRKDTEDAPQLRKASPRMHPTDRRGDGVMSSIPKLGQDKRLHKAVPRPRTAVPRAALSAHSLLSIGKAKKKGFQE